MTMNHSFVIGCLYAQAGHTVLATNQPLSFPEPYAIPQLSVA